MGDVVNLNRFRKQKARAERSEEAARNRTRFGRTKEEKLEQRKDAEKHRRDMDGKKLDDPV